MPKICDLRRQLKVSLQSAEGELKAEDLSIQNKVLCIIFPFIQMAVRWHMTALNKNFVRLLTMLLFEHWR